MLNLHQIFTEVHRFPEVSYFIWTSERTEQFRVFCVGEYSYVINFNHNNNSGNVTQWQENRIIFTQECFNVDENWVIYVVRKAQEGRLRSADLTVWDKRS